MLENERLNTNLYIDKTPYAALEKMLMFKWGNYSTEFCSTLYKLNL